ncbi:MAG: FAD-dependent oxidoreductase, partial [Rhodospirillales bacterium]
ADTLSPPAVVGALLGDCPRQSEAAVIKLEKGASCWRLMGRNGALGEAATVVLCSGAALPDLWPETLGPAPLPIRPNRGQVSLYELNGPTPRIGIGFGGYVSPGLMTASGRRFVLTGATYDDWPIDKRGHDQLRPDDDGRNRDLLGRCLPKLGARLAQRPFASRAALRATTPDRLPLVGGLFDTGAFEPIFGRSLRGARPEPGETLPYAEGLYLLGGLGSRGLLWAPLLARMLAARIAGSPLPVPRDVEERLLAQRFLARSIKRGKPLLP